MRRHWLKIIVSSLVVGCCAALVAVNAFAENKPAAKTPEKASATTERPAAQKTAPAKKKTAPAKKKAGPKGKWVEGSFETEMNGRWAGGHSDYDMAQSLRIAVNPPEYPRLHLRGLLWGNEELNGDVSRNSVLRDVNDAYDSNLRVRPLYLYAQIDNLWGPSALRIGRQRIQEGVAFNRIDGLYFRQTIGPVDWYVFGGARASVYRDTHKDGAFGGGASYRLSDKTRFDLDAYYGTEHRPHHDEVVPGLAPRLFGFSYPRRVRGDLGDDMVAFSVWQQILPTLQAFGRFTLHNGESDEFVFDLTGFATSWGLTYDVVYRRQFDTIEDRVTDLPGFYRILGPYRGYDDVQVSVHKSLTSRLALSLEAEDHNSRGSADLGNRDYTRYSVALGASKLLPGVDGTLSLARWDPEGSEGSWVVTGELNKNWGKVKLTLGADYEEYKEVLDRYNPYPFWTRKLAGFVIPGLYPNYMPLVTWLDTARVDTLDHVHSVYTKLKWAVCKNQDVTSRVTYEEDDGPQSPYWRARLSYEIRF